MGDGGQIMGTAGNAREHASGNGLVTFFGFQDTLSLDARGRFRLPDDLAAALRARSLPLPGASGYERLSFYFVPGTEDRAFLYPVPNVQMVIDRFENPPPGMDPSVVRRARDYLYHCMRYVEGDRQNRFSIPDAVREHAGITDDVQRITLVAHNHWLSLGRADLEEQRAQKNRQTFKTAVADLMDPVYPPAPTPPASVPEGDEQQ